MIVLPSCLYSPLLVPTPLFPLCSLTAEELRSAHSELLVRGAVDQAHQDYTLLASTQLNFCSGLTHNELMQYSYDQQEQ